MSQPIKAIIKKGAVRKDGSSLIFLQYCLNSEQRVLMNSSIAIPPQYWNRRLNKINENLPKQFGDVTELQAALTQKSAEPRIWFRMPPTKQKYVP